MASRPTLKAPFDSVADNPTRNRRIHEAVGKHGCRLEEARDHLGLCYSTLSVVAKRVDNGLESQDSRSAPGAIAALLTWATRYSVSWRGLAGTVRKSAMIEAMKEIIRAEMRVSVKHTLRKYGHPPDKAQTEGN